ncbi:unnamed protein product [Agarophyton chilense]
MQVVSFVNANCDVDVITANSTQFVSLMLKLVNNDNHGALSFSEKLRGFRYIALSDFALRVSSLIHALTVPLQLFLTGSQSRTHPPDARTAASQALITLSCIVSVAPTDTTDFCKLVFSTLIDAMEDEDGISMSARSAAVYWASECFSFPDAQARMINVIASSDNGPCVTQLAAIGLKSRKVPRKPTLGAKPVHSVAAFPDFSHVVIVYNIQCKNTNSAAIQFPHTFNFRSKTQSQNLEASALCVVLFASETKSLRQQVAEAFRHKLEDLFKMISRKCELEDVIVTRAIFMLVGGCADVLSMEEVQRLIYRFREGLEPYPFGVVSGIHGEDERVAIIMATVQVIYSAARRADVIWDESEKTPIPKFTAYFSKKIMLLIDSSDILRTTACEALADTGITNQLSLYSSSWEKILSTLTGILKLSSSPSKVAQAASNTLGNICVGEPRTSF